MIDIWMISSIVISGFMLIIKNRIDLLLVFYFSNFLYHHGIIFNNIYTGTFNEAPNPTAKAIVAVVFTSLVLVQVLERVLPRKVIADKFELDFLFSLEFKRLSKAFLVLSVTSTIVFIASAGADIFDGKAASKASGLSFSFFGSYYFAYACSGYFFLSKKYREFGLTVLIMILYLFVGTRAFAVLFVINLFILLSIKSKLFSLSNFKKLLFIVFVFVFLATYKHFYIALKAFNIEQLRLSLEDLDTAKLLWMLFSAEWSQIAMNVHRVTLLQNQYLYDFWDMVVMSVPGLNGWSSLPERFSEVIYFHANPGYTYGLGGAFWAEIWYAHGLLGVFVVSQLLLYYVIYCNSLLKSQIEQYLIHAPLVIFVVFYLPRNDVSLLFASFKNLLLSITLGLIFTYLVTWRKNRRCE